MISKPWLDHYDEGVPASLQPYPRTTLVDVISETARLRPAHPALIFKGARVSYAELEQHSDALAAALVKLGVKKGDRVAILMPNCPQYVIAEVAVWKAGGIAASVNPLYTEPEMEHALRECGAETAIVLSLFYNKLKKLQTKTPVRRVMVTNIGEYLPKALGILFKLLKEKKEGHRVSLHAGDLWYADLIRAHLGQPWPPVAVDPDDPALILFTGGTTGLSKAAYATHQALVMAGMQIRPVQERAGGMG